jgi:hypothetical protein
MEMACHQSQNRINGWPKSKFNSGVLRLDIKRGQEPADRFTSEMVLTDPMEGS